MILTKMKTITETYFKEQYTDAVITVPSNFNDLQRELIKDIAIISGFKVLCVLSELSAASLTSGLNEKCNINRHILIYDLGRRAFNVSLLDIDDGSFKLKATERNIQLGGDNFDTIMVNFLANRFQYKFKSDLRNSSRALRTLRTACERAKRKLSTDTQASIICDSIYS